MTRDQFFNWAEAQEERYEFDGFQPVAMTGGSLNHSQFAKTFGPPCAPAFAAPVARCLV